MPSDGARARAKPGVGGHSLIELLVVLVIMGLATSLAVPALREAPHAARPEAVGRLASLLRAASADAAQQGSATSVVLDVGSATVWVLRSRGVDGGRLLRSDRLPSDAGVRLGARSSRPMWRFAAGRLARGDSVTVRSEMGAWLVFVDPFTGRVQIEEAR